MKTIMRALAAAFAIAALSVSGAPAYGAETTGGEDLFDKISSELMCLCGCNQTIKNCPHINCDFAVPARKVIRQHISKGEGHDEIVSFFIEKNGQVILAQPKKEGFNLVGYIFPFIAIISVGGGVVALVREWASRGEKKKPASAKAAKPSAPAGDESLVEKMKKELSEFDE